MDKDIINKNKILIFSHNYLVRNWKEVVIEQLEKLKNSELYNNAHYIYYGVYSENDIFYHDFLDIINTYDEHKKINITIYAENNYEMNTLSILQQTVKNYDDCYVLYYHTKGVTSERNHDNVNLDKVKSWRHILEYFNIERWKDCVNSLKNHDICGVLYIGDNGHPWKNYYSGNFWWGNSDYINKLPLVTKLEDKRMACELWIGKNNHRWVNLYPMTWGYIYDFYFDPKEYRK